MTEILTPECEHRFTALETALTDLPRKIDAMQGQIADMQVKLVRNETKLDEIHTVLYHNGLASQLHRVEIKQAWMLGGLGVVAAIALAGLSLGIKWFAG